MSANKDLNKVLDSSNELDDFEFFEKKNDKHQEPLEDDNKKVFTKEEIHFVDEEESNDEVDEDIENNISSVYEDKPQKISITRNVGKIFDVPEEAVIQTMKDNQIYNKKFSVKILGVGGAGNNIIKYVYNSRKWPDFVSIKALNTDFVALKNIPELDGSLYLIGKDELNGNGSGGDPEMGKRAATADAEEIKKMLEGTDILIIVAGLGKGTGTGASPIIAEIAKELGILTIGLFNLPSIGAEGNKTYSNALSGLEKLSYICSGFTAISNDRIIGMDRERTSIKKAYQDANEYMRMIIDEFINIITNAADVNVDFSDIKNFFNDQNGFLFQKVDITDYTKDAIKEAIEEKIHKGFTDIDINESKNAIFNFKINENVPSVILENARTAMKEIVRTNDLNIVNGISFSDKYENAEINILIAGKFELGRIVNSEISSNDLSSNQNDDIMNPSINTEDNDDILSIIQEYNSKTNNFPSANENIHISNDSLNSKPIEEKKKSFFSKMFKK